MFTPVTTYASGEPVKTYAWSYSKLKNWRTCKKRYMEIDIRKNFKEKKEPGGPLDYGDAVHAAMAERVGKLTPLPGLMADFEKYAQKVEIGRSEPGVQLMVEQKFGIRRDFSPCDFFGGSVWYRGVADVLKVVGDVALVVDWKTGKVIEDAVQLALASACVFAHHPQVNNIRTEFVWLGNDATSRIDVRRDQMPTLWAQLMPELDDLEFDTRNGVDTPNPSGLCKTYCAVTSCEFYGKGSR